MSKALVAYLTNERPFASVRLGVLPHGTMAGKFFATNFTLEFVLRQMFRPMLLHFFHRIETLPALWTLDFVEIDERIAEGEGQGQRVLIVSQLIVVEHFRTTQLDFTIFECGLQRVEHGTRLTGNSHPGGSEMRSGQRVYHSCDEDNDASAGGGGCAAEERNRVATSCVVHDDGVARLEHVILLFNATPLFPV